MIITSPEKIKSSITPSVFLAGGITNCPDWQKEFINFYKETYSDTFDIFNPRREFWDDNRNNDDISKEQIEWENNYLKKSTGIVFWFPKETLCPITLFELGAALHSQNIIAIGIHSEYARKLDVEVQTKLVNKDIPIVYSVKDLCDETVEYFKNYKSFEDYDKEISTQYENFRKNIITKNEAEENITELQMEQYSKLTKNDIIKEAKKFIIDYGWIDGENHKVWVIDQVFRILTGKQYLDELYDACLDEDDEIMYDWYEGITS